jgi:hypothetical protein
MEPTTRNERCAAEALVGALGRLLAVLAVTSAGDIEWLRPLAVLSAEIEHGVLRRPTIDVLWLADACHELTVLLAGCPRAASEFALRYPEARRSSPAVATLHERTLAVCCDVTRRHTGAGLAR